MNEPSQDTAVIESSVLQFYNYTCYMIDLTRLSNSDVLFFEGQMKQTNLSGALFLRFQNVN